jgi:hypothetical protein
MFFPWILAISLHLFPLMGQAPAQSSGTEQSQQSEPAPAANPPSAQTLPCTTAGNKSSSATPCATTPAPRHRKPKAVPSDSDPSKTVVRNGGTTEPGLQFAPSVPTQQASQQLQETNRMLEATEENMKKLSGQTLDSGQQDTAAQIRNYTEKAKEAIASGDIERAHILATKANALAADLAKPGTRSLH